MGSGEGKVKIKNSTTGLEYLQNLIPNVEEQLSVQIQAQLKQQTLEMPKISEEIQNLYNYLKEVHFEFEKCSPEDYEYLNILSQFQIKLLEPSERKGKSEEWNAVQKFEPLKIEYIKSLRLLDLNQLDGLKFDDYIEFGWIVKLIKGIKNYCVVTNNLIQKFKIDKEIQWILYITIWEHFSQKLHKLSEQYSFSKINHAFDQYYYTNLRPYIKVETLGAKIWGGYVQIDKEFALNQILQGRLNRNSHLPLNRIATVFMEMNIDVYNLQFAGSDEFVRPKFIFKLQEQTKQLYETNFNGDYEDFLQFWKSDNQYILTIFPEWIVEKYINTILFDFIEDLFLQQILKLNLDEQQQINNAYLKEFQIIPILLDENHLCTQDVFSLQSHLNFDQFLRSQQEPTISILTKRVSNEKKNSDIIRSNITANNSGVLVDHQLVMQQLNQKFIGEQDYSDIQSESKSSNLSSTYLSKQIKLKNLSLQELEKIMYEYDIIKFPIISRIEARNQRIKMETQNIRRIDDEFRCLFSFENQNIGTIQKKQKFYESLLQKVNKVQSQISQKDYSKSIADMILEI